ncbi:MAG: ATP-binding cassette domain-containing protein [Nocardioidaceae bacterium]
MTPIDGGAVVEVESLTKRYAASNHLAVDHASFSVNAGEIFGLLGPNGAGKTTTVEVLQGLRPRDSGLVRVLGLDPAKDSDRLQRRIGSQLQSSALPARLRVGEAVTLFGSMRGCSALRIRRVLEEWDLDSLGRRPYASLSGGQRQRLFLALAMLGEPEVIFLDELTTGLDPAARRATWTLIQAVRDRGATVLLVTHLMEEAESLCDRVAIMHGGQIVALDHPLTLASTHGGTVRTTFTGDADIGRLRELAGVEDAIRRGPRIEVNGDSQTPILVAAELNAQSITPRDFRTQYPSLEDVFLELTGRRMSSLAEAP